MSANVRIDEAIVSSSPSEHRKVEALLPIARRLARSWRINFVLTVPHGTAASPQKGEKTVFVHIFGKPAKNSVEANAAKGKLVSAYGYTVPQSSVHPLAAALGGGASGNAESVSTFLLLKPEEAPDAIMIENPGSVGQQLAAVLPGNIYILFDICDTHWAGRDIVFRTIIEEAMPYALEGVAPLTKPHCAERFVAWRLEHRQRIFRRQKAVPKSFADISLKRVATEVESAYKAARETQEKDASAQRALTDNIERRRQLQEFLASRLVSLEECREDLGSEFDVILRIDGVRTLRVIEQDSRKVLQVSTDRIWHRQQDKAEVDVGEWVMTITPFPNSSISGTAASSAGQLIKFAQPRWKGTHQHSHAKVNGGNTCFGVNADDGLNQALAKHLADHRYVEAIHLVITFLQLEASNAVPLTGGIPEYSPPSSSLFYEDDAERELHREAYIDFIYDVRIRGHRQTAQRELQKLEESESKTVEGAITARRLKQQAQEYLTFLEQQQSSYRTDVVEQWERLLIHPDVCEARFVGDSLVVLLRPLDRFGVIQGPAWLWIRPDSGTVWLRGLTEGWNGRVRKDSTVELTPEERTFFLRQLGTGRFADAVFGIWDIVTQRNSPSDEGGAQGAAKTGGGDV